MVEPVPAPASRWSRIMPRGSHVFALAVLLASLFLVLTTWQSARDREIAAARQEFASFTDESVSLVVQRIDQYELMTRGGVSLFASVARPTPRQWQAYVEGMHVGDRYPAIVGLGFAGYVPAGRLADLQLEWRESGYGLLNIRPRGIRPAYGPVLYLEPRRPENVAAIGFDMYAEKTRHEAMAAALRTGQPRLSGPVRLVQDGATAQTGLILYLPIYRAGDEPQSVEARLISAQGWIYLPFRIEPLMRTMLGDRLDRVHLRVHDITSGASTQLFEGGQRTEAPAFTRSVVVDVHGRRWRFDFASLELARAAPGLQPITGTLALGLVAALLMYAVAFALAHTESRARTIARTLTEEFRRSELRFRSAMEYSAIGKALLDSGGAIVDANPALAAMLGRPLETLRGTSFDALFEDGPGDVRRDEDVAVPGVWRAMRRIQRQDGSVRHVHLTYSPVPGKSGEDVTGLVQLEDVTERLLAEARVHALNRTLEARVELRTRELMRANHELETFAYSVSHDLRAPLRAIDGFSRILAERYADRLDESGRGYLARVRRAAGRMGELIDSMLQLSRLSRSALKVEPVDLSRIAAEILEELQMADPSRAVEAIVSPGLVVEGDASLLRNLIANLLGNAWKFTQQRDVARIEFGMDAGEYFVRDNGAGFDQEYVDKLFRPFQRLHNEEQFVGHGIGLATVRKIVERHGGTIRAEGRVGEGATFYFTLPGVTEA